LINHQPIKIFGKDYPTLDGTCSRDYFHVEDLIEAIILAISKWNQLMVPKEETIKTENNEIVKEDERWKVYNLGQGQGFTVLQIYKQIGEYYLKNCCLDKHSRVGSMVFVERREGDPPSLLADCGKAWEELGWKAKKDLSEIIKDTIKEIIIVEKIDD
jgi:UDP-glucose 4-epimerase